MDTTGTGSMDVMQGNSAALQDETPLTGDIAAPAAPVATPEAAPAKRGFFGRLFGTPTEADIAARVAKNESQLAKERADVAAREAKLNLVKDAQTVAAQKRASLTQAKSQLAKEQQDVIAAQNNVKALEAEVAAADKAAGSGFFGRVKGLFGRGGRSRKQQRKQRGGDDDDMPVESDMMGGKRRKSRKQRKQGGQSRKQRKQGGQQRKQRKQGGQTRRQRRQ